MFVSALLSCQWPYLSWISTAMVKHRKGSSNNTADCIHKENRYHTHPKRISNYKNWVVDETQPEKIPCAAHWWDKQTYQYSELQATWASSGFENTQEQLSLCHLLCQAYQCSEYTKPINSELKANKLNQTRKSTIFQSILLPLLE